MKKNNLMGLLSVWGILLVVLGHSGFEEPVIKHELAGLHTWIYSFHMPLFFMISGYLFSYTNKMLTQINLFEFIYKKVLRLLVPYVTLGVSLYGIKYIFSSFSHATRGFSISNFFLMFICPANSNSTMGYLWYVFTLFVIFILILALCKIHINLKNPYWSIPILFFFLFINGMNYKIEWFNLSSVFRYIPYFILGIIYNCYESKINLLLVVPPSQYLSNNKGCSCIKNQKYVVLFKMIIVFLIYLFISLVLQYTDLYTSSIYVQFIKAFIGILLSIQLCLLLLNNKFIQKKVSPMSKYTYSIYLLSWFGQYAVKILVVNILGIHWILVVLLMFVGGVVFPICICKIIERKSILGKQTWLRLVVGY